MTELTEIKKLFTKFKKAGVKEGLDINGCCYMTAKQLENRTATILLVACPDVSYESEMDYIVDTIERVKGYTTWTPEEIENSVSRNTLRLENVKRLQTTFGTKANEADYECKRIVSSNAFKAFASAVGVVQTAMVKNKNGYYLRLSY